MPEELRKYIDEHSTYFWYTPESEKHNISEALLVESILNDGTMDDVRSLIKLMGIDKVADILFSAKGREKQNYYPEIRHFFTLAFNRYAHRDY